MTSSDEQNSILVELENKHVASLTQSEEYFRELKHLVFKKGKAISPYYSSKTSDRNH